MNMASLELCKELYELSGWGETAYSWYRRTKRKYFETPLTVIESDESIEIIQGLGSLPAYDLSCLLRKFENFELTFNGLDYGAWYKHIRGDRIINQRAKTPEDAAAKLAIELFKQGILAKD